MLGPGYGLGPARHGAGHGADVPTWHPCGESGPLASLLRGEVEAPTGQERWDPLHTWLSLLSSLETFPQTTPHLAEEELTVVPASATPSDSAHPQEACPVEGL